MTTQRIFVAGATGVLGRRAVRALVADGARGDRHRPLPGEGRGPPLLGRHARRDRSVRRRRRDRCGRRATMWWPTWRRTSPAPARRPCRARGRRTTASGGKARGTSSTPHWPLAPAATSRSRCVSSTPTGATPGWTRTRRSTWWATSTRSPPRSSTTERFTAAGGSGVFLRFGMFYAPDAHHVIDQVAWARRGVSMEAGELDAYKSMIHADDAAAAVVAALGVAGRHLQRGRRRAAHPRRPHRPHRRARGSHQAQAGRAPHAPPRRLEGRRARPGRSGCRTGGSGRPQGWAPTFPSIREGSRPCSPRSTGMRWPHEARPVDAHPARRPRLVGAAGRRLGDLRPPLVLRLVPGRRRDVGRRRRAATTSTSSAMSAPSTWPWWS